MKILVTVGTTKFDQLIYNVDKYYEDNIENEVIFQTANSDITTNSGVSHFYINNIDELYTNSDLIITHGGAGSIYKLLELRKKIIVCPNFTRIDHHQDEICRYIEKNNYALVAWKVEDIANILFNIESFTPNIYEKQSFFKFQEILDSLS